MSRLRLLREPALQAEVPSSSDHTASMNVLRDSDLQAHIHLLLRLPALFFQCTGPRASEPASGSPLGDLRPGMSHLGI